MPGFPLMYRFGKTFCGAQVRGIALRRCRPGHLDWNVDSFGHIHDHDVAGELFVFDRERTKGEWNIDMLLPHSRPYGHATNTASSSNNASPIVAFPLPDSQIRTPKTRQSGPPEQWASQSASSV